MTRRKITMGGQISLPADVRRRWDTDAVSIEDRGDSVVVRPLPKDPVAAVRGIFAGRIPSTTELRRIAREDELAAERRRRRR
jgi:bifunctional DNA-binding transcriptional regulator/antitoxin component of YhaV-PrlF toxin-antitoxin module